MPAQSRPQAESFTAATKELEFTRMLDAPIERVFRAWTDAEQLKQWFGPKDFTVAKSELEPRAGGKLYIVMRGPDGTDYPMSGKITRIEPPAKFAFTSVAEDKDGTPHLEGFTSVNLIDEGGKTRLEVRDGAVTLSEQGLKMMEGMDEGWSQTLDRLTAFVEKK